MKFKQGTVLCLYNSMEGRWLKPEKGWIDTANEFGFVKVNAKLWKAIDIETGTSVAVGATRKECVALVEEKLEEIRSYPSRAKWIEIKENAPINGTFGS